MSKTTDYIINNNIQQEEVDDREYFEIEAVRKALSIERGYEVGFYEAKTHYLLSKVEDQVVDINKTIDSQFDWDKVDEAYENHVDNCLSWGEDYR